MKNMNKLKMIKRLIIFLLFGFLSFQCGSESVSGIVDENCNINLSLNTNPWAPLAGLAEFNTEGEFKIMVRVMANQDGGQEIQGEFDDFNTSHRIPILGLYPDFNNRVEIIRLDRDGNGARQVCNLQTNPLPVSIPQLNIVVNNIPADEKRFYFVGGNGADFIFDKTGAVRWYLGEHEPGLVYNQLSR